MILAKCRSCGASIVWMKTKNDKNMPINSETANGSTVFNSQEGHISHFSTCPNAVNHRKSISRKTRLAAPKKPAEGDIETMGDLF